MTERSPQAKERPALVFLLDVDNTLLDNDALKAALAERIEAVAGPRAAHFWELYEKVREEHDYVDYPETVTRFLADEADQKLGPLIHAIFDDLRFESYLYPGVIETLTYLKSLGTAIILSDGDTVFQPTKIEKSGLEAAVDGNVLIYVHKEEHLDDVFARYPAGHYVVVDDKPRILSVLEQCCPTTFTTILVLQGHYGVQGQFSPPPDMVLHHISDLQHISAEQFREASSEVAATQ